MELTNRQVLEHLQKLSADALDETFTIKTNCVFLEDDKIKEYDSVSNAGKYDTVYVYVTNVIEEKNVRVLCNMFNGVLHD
jgi:hypothetical protein